MHTTDAARVECEERGESVAAVAGARGERSTGAAGGRVQTLMTLGLLLLFLRLFVPRARVPAFAVRAVLVVAVAGCLLAIVDSSVGMPMLPLLVLAVSLATLLGGFRR